MFNHFQVGDAPANRGVLLLIAKNDRKCRIELGAGYSASMDRVAQRIINHDLVPEFRAGHYEQGIQDGVQEIAKSLAGYHAESKSPDTNWNWIAAPAGVLGLIATLTSISLYWNRKRGWGWVAVGLVYVNYLRVRNAVTRSSHGARGSSSSGGGGWSSDFGSFGGDGGGGGFGGGGGSSTGGGASGSW